MKLPKSSPRLAPILTILATAVIVITAILETVSNGFSYFPFAAVVGWVGYGYMCWTHRGCEIEQDYEYNEVDHPIHG